MNATSELTSRAVTADFTERSAWRAARPFMWMLLCSGILCFILFYNKRTTVFPIIYAHYLVSYEFGLIKRGLVGELASLVLSKVSYYHVIAVGLLAWLTTLVTYFAAFSRTFTLSAKTFPLLVIILGSPFFLKNFMFTIVYFDIFGCLAALIALLLPVTFILPIIMGAICCILILIHHLHFLLYIPTIALIVIIRGVATQRLSPHFLFAGIIATLSMSSLFLYLAFNGSVTEPMDAFIEALRARATAPEHITPHWVRIWYTDIQYEIQQTMAMLPGNALRFPVYIALVLIHLPLISFFRQMIRNLSHRRDRILVTAGLIATSLAYIPIFIVVYDYSRWVSNWATCMILTMHAVRLLPATEVISVPIDPANPRNRWFGWAISLVPRVGIIKPF